MREVASLITPVPGGVGQDDDRDAAWRTPCARRSSSQRRRSGAASRDEPARARSAAARAARSDRRSRRARRAAAASASRTRIPASRPIGGRRVDAHADGEDVIEGAFIPLWVRGEVSDFKAHRNGHWYFCLRDARGAAPRASSGRAISAASPRRPTTACRSPRSAGSPSTRRAARCSSPSRASKPRATACGARRSRSRARGSKPTACSRPSASARCRASRACIAVVTSPDGAALHDIVAVVRRRARERAARRRARPRCRASRRRTSSARALDRVNRWGGADVVIIGRGGGAREDLWAFNDERVARAVAACPCRRSPPSATRSTSRSAISSPTFARPRRPPRPKPRRRSRAELRRAS